MMKVTDGSDVTATKPLSRSLDLDIPGLRDAAIIVYCQCE